MKLAASPDNTENPEVLKEHGDLDGSGLQNSPGSPPEPMMGRDRIDYYLNHTFGVSSLLGSAASSAVRQATKSMPEWGEGMDGYSAHYASSMGRRLIRNSIDHGLSALFGSDPRYYGSERSGIWARSLYAAGQTLVTHKGSGQARFAYEHVLGTVGGVIISRSWYPENRRTVGECASSAAISFGVDAARNVVREFWPDIKNYLLKR